MRRNILFILSILIGLIGFSQNVNNIIGKQDGSNIQILYEIENSNSNQIFDVTISCLVNNDKKIVLKAIKGDVGENILGGKEQYVAVWDVLKEVDELTNAEFFVDIVLVSKVAEIIPVLPDNQHKWWVSTNSGFWMPFGVTAGYMDKWGAYLAFRSGSIAYESYDESYVLTNHTAYTDVNGQAIPEAVDLLNFNSEYTTDSYDFSYSITIGGMRQLINKEKFKMHVYLGGGLGFWDEWPEYTSYQGVFQQDTENEYSYTLNNTEYDDENQLYIPGHYAEDQSYDVQDIDGNTIPIEETIINSRTKTFYPEFNFEMETGLVFSINRFTIKTGISTCAFYKYDVTFGLGYVF